MIPLHSNLQEFKKVADWHLSGTSDNAFFDLQPILASLAFESSFLSDSVNAELGTILKTPSQTSSRWKSSHMVGAAEPKWQLHYGLVCETREFIHSHACHAMYAVVGPEPLVVDYYRPSFDIDSDVFDPAATLTQPRREIHPPGSICVVDARREIADIVAKSPTVVVSLLGPTRRAIQWIFSRQTLRAVQSIPSNPTDAEIAILIRALTAMRGATSIATLCELTLHESHFVRWTALQALLELSPEAAKTSLQRAREDAHPQVRSASERAIAAMAA